MPQILENATGNGDGSIIDWNGNDKAGTLQIEGTWDGATVEIKGSIDGGTTFTTPQGATFTSDIISSFQMGPGKVKATVSNAGASTDLNAHVSPG
jgi:hypothetical protein